MSLGPLLFLSSLTNRSYPLDAIDFHKVNWFYKTSNVLTIVLSTSTTDVF